MNAHISVIFKEAHRKEVIAGAKLIGKHVLADDFVGPVFTSASIEPAGIDGMVLIKPDDADVAYLYNIADIARIRVERNKVERSTASGIVIASVTPVVPKQK